MASISRWYQNFMNEYQDEVTRDWFLVGSDGKLILIIAAYIYLVTSLGPRLMRDRKPFKLTKLIQFYDVIQIILNVFLCCEGIKSGWFTTMDFRCEPVDYSKSELAFRMRRAVWLYYIIKLTDLLDTVFFVLRKKYNQVTFLHIYHHSLMPVCGYIGVTFVPGGHGSFMGLINSFIHIILYSYYFLSSFGPHMQKYLWWKSYVTQLQLVQFVVVFIHNVQVLPRECAYPKFFNVLLATQAGFFMYLFGSFYIRAYIKKVPQPTIIKDRHQNGKVLTNGHTNGTAKPIELTDKDK